MRIAPAMIQEDDMPILPPHVDEQLKVQGNRRDYSLG